MTKGKGIYTAHKCDNKFLVSHVAKMYLKEGDRIADITYGKGIFWRNINTDKYDFYPSDLLTCDAAYDFRDLPYKNNSFDVVVFDPPYCHNPGKLLTDSSYLNRDTTKGMYHKDIINLYKDGITEAVRTLKEGGFLWVKCMDELESGIQRWSHIEIYNLAIKFKLFAKDMFVLVQSKYPVIQYKNQKHARKNHSYLWIFKKPIDREKKLLKKHNIW
jgi:tRNA G10  N-methylase Trm11